MVRFIFVGIAPIMTWSPCARMYLCNISSRFLGQLHTHQARPAIACWARWRQDFQRVRGDSTAIMSDWTGLAVMTLSSASRHEAQLQGGASDALDNRFCDAS